MQGGGVANVGILAEIRPNPCMNLIAQLLVIAALGVSIGLGAANGRQHRSPHWPVGSLLEFSDDVWVQGAARQRTELTGEPSRSSQTESRWNQGALTVMVNVHPTAPSRDPLAVHHQGFQ